MPSLLSKAFKTNQKYQPNKSIFLDVRLFTLSISLKILRLIKKYFKVKFDVTQQGVYFISLHLFYGVNSVFNYGSIISMLT